MALPQFKPGEYPEKTFLKNAKDARDNGQHLLCAECGMGIMDEGEFGSEDNHDIMCPNTGRDPDQEQLDWLMEQYGKAKARAEAETE